MPVWISASRWEACAGLPASASTDAFPPDLAADVRRSDPFRSQIRLIDSILGSPVQALGQLELERDGTAREVVVGLLRSGGVLEKLADVIVGMAKD
eukprot:6204032-Pyramimonas_sp.AAC.1